MILADNRQVLNGCFNRLLVFGFVAIIQERNACILLQIQIGLFGGHFVMLGKLADDENNICRFEFHSTKNLCGCKGTTNFRYMQELRPKKNKPRPFLDDRDLLSVLNGVTGFFQYRFAR